MVLSQFDYLYLFKKRRLRPGTGLLHVSARGWKTNNGIICFKICFNCIYSAIYQNFIINSGRGMRKIKYWREDSFLSTNGTILKYDKLEHALLGLFGMMVTLLWLKPVGIQPIILFWLGWNLVGLLWEIFQVFVQNQKLEIKDIAANNIGFVVAGLAFGVVG